MSKINERKPQNQLSNLLQEDENKILLKILGDKQVTLATAVAQVLQGFDGRWHKRAAGVLCFLKDYTHHSYCFRAFNLQSRKIIFEEPVRSTLHLEKSFELFYTFDGQESKIGLNFVEESESMNFYQIFEKKQIERRQKKQDKKLQPKSSMPTVEPKDMPKIELQTDQSQKTKRVSILSPFHFKDVRKSEISSPDEASFKHITSINLHNSFCHDKLQQNFFEEVLSTMKISPEDRAYVRRMYNIKIDQDNYSTDEVRTSIQIRAPFQDIALPSLTRFDFNRNMKNSGQDQNSAAFSTLNSQKPITDSINQKKNFSSLPTTSCAESPSTTSGQSTGKASASVFQFPLVSENHNGPPIVPQRTTRNDKKTPEGTKSKAAPILDRRLIQTPKTNEISQEKKEDSASSSSIPVSPPFSGYSPTSSNSSSKIPVAPPAPDSLFNGDSHKIPAPLVNLVDKEDSASNDNLISTSIQPKHSVRTFLDDICKYDTTKLKKIGEREKIPFCTDEKTPEDNGNRTTIENAILDILSRRKFIRPEREQSESEEEEWEP